MFLVDQHEHSNNCNVSATHSNTSVDSPSPTKSQDPFSEDWGQENEDEDEEGDDEDDDSNGEFQFVEYRGETYNVKGESRIQCGNKWYTVVRNENGVGLAIEKDKKIGEVGLAKQKAKKVEGNFSETVNYLKLFGQNCHSPF